MKIFSKNQIKTLLIILSTGGCFMPIHAQTSKKLPAANIIGSYLSFDYTTNKATEELNTKSDAFDEDFDTFFAAYDLSGAWVGLDLKERHIITKIAYAPRNDSDGPGRMIVGLFEGANNQDFSDAVPLFIVCDTPQVDAMTEHEINCSRGFRYVRYCGPYNSRCTIADLAFYGYKGTGDNSFFPQLTNLPTITISTVNAAGIYSRDKYVSGFISVIQDGVIYSDLLEIRGRGHFSWTFPKKPYRIKLRNKTNLLGLPAKERNWTLISNYGDKALMRNLLAFDLSRRLEMEYTPAGISVDLIVNGEYKGTYNLCDQIETNPGRIEIQPMSARDIVLPDLSGGYFLEVDAYADQDDDGWFNSAIKNTPVKIRSPKADEIVSQQYYYIREHYNKMEESVFSPDFKDPITGFRHYIDTESFIRHFLVGEISGDTDTYWSVYLYKDRNKDIFKFGPVWDVDLGFENDSRTYPINSHPQWVFEYGSSAQGFSSLIKRIFEDEEFRLQLRTTYIDYRESGVLSKESLLQVVDNYASELEQSQRLNFLRWKILGVKVHQNPQAFESYEEAVNHMKYYISERIDWIDNKFEYEPSGNTFITAAPPPVVVYTQSNTINITPVLDPVYITITDLTGRIIISKMIRNQISVPVSKGMYFITVFDPSKGLRKTVKCAVFN